MTPSRRSRDRRCRYPTDAAAREGTRKLNAAQRRRWWARNSKRLADARWKRRVKAKIERVNLLWRGV